MTDSPFRIDILDSSGNPVGSGPLTNIMQLDDVRVLDKIGTLIFVMPANDPKREFITASRLFDVYDEVDGYIGRYIFNNQSIVDMDGKAMLIVNCLSMLKELVYNIAGFAREYAATHVNLIVDDLMDDISGWTTTTEGTMGLANVTYQGQTVYQAVEELAKRWAYHFRLTTTLRELEFKALGVLNTDIRLTNLQGQSDAIDNVSDVGIIKKIKQKIATDEVFNRVIAVGAGTGAGMLVLLDNEVGDTYTVTDRTRTNGETEYYIEDIASQTAYGIRETVLIFDQIRPIANTATAKTQAQTELLKNAERWLTRYKDAREQYDNLVVYNLGTDLNVGDKVHVRYKGFDVENNLYLDVDDNLWVTQIVRNRRATGQRSATLRVVNIDRNELTDQDVMAQAVKAIHSEKLWIKPSAFSQSDTYTDTIQNGDVFYTDKEAEFVLTFDDTVTDITRVVLEWRTKPLFTMSAWNQNQTLVTGNANPSTPHNHTIASALNQGWFSVVTSPNFPSDVSMEINGTNVDNHADIDYISGGTGEWNSASQNTALSVKMDITDFILNAVGGIYQTFTIKLLTNISVSRDVSVPYWTSSPPLNLAVGNGGIVEMKILTQGIAQAIYKS